MCTHTHNRRIRPFQKRRLNYAEQNEIVMVWTVTENMKIRTETIGKKYILKMDVEKMI